MADIPMKSIQWPGLPDTYTFLQKASTLTDSDAGKAADAAVVGEALGQLQAGYVAADEVLGQRIDQLEAEIDTDSGEAPTLVAGTAEQLLSTTGAVNPTPYTYRENTSGSDRVTISQITGGTVAFNQLVVDDNVAERTNNGVTVSRTGGLFTVTGTGTANSWNSFSNFKPTAILDHVYLLLLSNDLTGTAGVQFAGFTTWLTKTTTSKIGKCTETATATSLQTRIVENESWNNSFYLGFFDLTQMFGATVAQYFLDLETATAGAGVALFRTMFPESYYPYNAGELVSVQTSGRKTVGVNLFDKSTATIGKFVYGNYTEQNNSKLSHSDYIRVIAGATYTASGFVRAANVWTFIWYDGSKNPIGRAANYTETAPSGCKYVIVNFTTTAIDTVQLNLGTTAAPYEPYSAHTYPLDSTLTLRGIPVLTDGVPAYDGDKYAPDGTVTRRYMLIPNLGALDWIYSPTNGIFYTANSAFMGVHATYQVLASGVYNQSKSKYGANFATVPDKIICLVSNQPNLAIKDTSYSDATEFKAAVSGISAVVALATPTTETAAPYQEIQIAGSTEEFLPPASDTRPVAVPVGSQSLYQTNLREGLETLLNTDLAHAESIAPVQGNTASTNIAEGELLMQDGKLYTATQAIVAGAEIGATNTTATTIAAQLAALAARIAALEN